MTRYLDTGTIIVIIITIILFVFALFLKGFTKDLLLEAGVLLVSVKLILMAYRTSTNYHDIKKELDEIKELLKQKQ
jgi:putative effector of murein hydrolase